MKFECEWGIYQDQLKIIGKTKSTPNLNYNLIQIWDAFCDLNSTRQGLNPITLTEINSWLDLNGITNLDSKQEIMYLIRKMDEEFFKIASNKLKRK